MDETPHRPTPNIWEVHHGTRVYRGDTITTLDRPDVLDGPASPAPVHALPLRALPDPERVFDATAEEDAEDEDQDDGAEPQLFYIPSWDMRVLGWFSGQRLWLQVTLLGTVYVHMLALFGFYLWGMVFGPPRVFVGLSALTMFGILIETLRTWRRTRARR